MATSLTDQFLEQQSKGSLTDQMVTSTDPASKEVFDLPKTDYDDLMRSASEEHGVPYEVLYRNIRQESGFNPKAVSKTGARGIAQFIPSTAKAMGIKDPHDPKQAIPGAARYIKQLYDQFGDWKLAIAAYNAGPEAVKRAGNKIPNIDETQKHIKAVFPDGKEYPRPGAKQTTISRGGLTDALMQVESKIQEQKVTTTKVSEPKVETSTNDTKGFYSEKPSLNILTGIWHPEMAASLARRGYGPKVSINEFGLPVDEKGNEIYKQGVNDKEARPSAFGKEMIISEDKSKPSFVKRALASVADLLGIEIEPKLSEVAKAQAVVKLMADEAGVPVGQYRVAPEFIEQAASSFVNSASFGIIPAIRKEMTGEEDFEVSSTPGHVGQALGSLGGLMLGPFKVGEKVMSPLLRVMPRATQEGKIAGRILKESLHDAVVLSAGMGLAATGEALEKTTFGQAAGAIGKAAGSGAMTGAIFGTARGLFPAEGIETGTRLITGLIGLNAYRAVEVGGNPFTDRPVGDVVFDTALDALFLYRGLPKNRVEELIKDVEDINRSYDRIKKTKDIIQEAPPDVQAQINAKALEVEEARLKYKYDSFVEKIGGDVELLYDYGMLSDNLAKSKIRPETYSRPEMAEDYVAKPVKMTKKEQAKVEKEQRKVEAEKPVEPATKESLQELIEANPELAGKIRVDALGEEGTTLLPGNAQVTILEPGKESSFTAKADIGDIVERYKSKLGEYEVAEKKKGTTVITRKKSGESIKKFKELDLVVPEIPKDVPPNLRYDFSDQKPGESDADFINRKLEEPIVPPELQDAKKSTKPELKVIKGGVDYTGAEETMSPELLKHLDSMIEESEAPVKSREKVTKLAEKEPEVITEIDKGTGSDVPSEVINDSFMRPLKDAENLDRIFKERKKALGESPEMYVQKLINDVRLWKHGKDVDIKAVRSALSEMGARAGELRHFFDTGVDHIQFMDVAREAAKWAQNTGRIKTGGPRLNVMIPLDQIPDSVRHWYNYTKGMFGKVGSKDVYRNRELWKATGFWYGRDGKWRFELDDSGAKYAPSKNMLDNYKATGFASEKLTAVLDHPKLYEQVPKLKDANIEYDKNLPGKGEYRIDSNTVVLKAPHYKNTLFHEIAHGINREANAFSGGSPGGVLTERFRGVIKDLKNVAKTDEVRREISDVEKSFNKGYIGLNEAAEHIMAIVDRRAPKSADKFAEKLNEILDAGSAFDEYKRIPGEMESRLTERRLNMSKEARMSEPPWQTLDRMLAQEGINPEVGRKLYSGLPVDKVIDITKKLLRNKILSKEFMSRDDYIKGVAARDKRVGEVEKGTIDILGTEYTPGMTLGDYKSRKEFQENRGYEDINRLREERDNVKYDIEQLPEIVNDRVRLLEKYDEAVKSGDKDKIETYRDFLEDHYISYGMNSDLVKTGKSTGFKLYSGVPLDEAAKAIVAGAKKVAEYTTKARGMKKFKPGAAFQKVREEFVRSAIDRSGNIRKDLIEILGEDGYKVVQKMYLAKGASARSVKELKQMKAEVYEGLSVREKKILDDIILDDRMIDIAKYRGEGEFNFPKGLTPKDFIAHRTLFGEIEGLSKEQVAKLNQRASAYFEWMKKPLKDMLESGLISKEEFDKLASHNYRRIKLVDIFDKRYSTKVGDKKRTVYDSGVEALARGRETDIYEPSSEIMALEVFNRAYGRILNNEANKMLLELAEKDNENPFVRIKSKDRNEKIPSGWNRIFVFDKGERKSLWISPEMGKEWIIRSPEISYKMGQVLRYASGSPVLRTFATGINWGFALANIPRDVMHTWFTARTWKDGEWKPVYSPHAPMFALQMGRDISNVFLDAALRKGRYNNYIDQGGGMEFLVHQGRLLQRGRHVDSKLGDVLDFMGYFGETSEIMTRLAIRDRVIRNEAKKRGISFEEASKDKDITAEATFAARDYMDFGQGGGISKAADNALPYLNAAIQGTRGIMRSFKPGSGSALESTYKLAQFGTAVVGTYIAANALAPNTMKSLQGDVAMQSNLCIPLGDEFSFQDENGETRYIYLKMPLDPGQKFFKTIFEGATDKWLGNEVDVDRITGTLNDMSPVGISQLPPTISATLGYMSNKDFWLNEDIWKGTDKAFPYPQSKEEFTGKTPQAYVDVGKVTGLSPERTKYAVEELITNGTIWSYLINQGYDAAFGDISKERKEQHIAMVLARFPGIKRFIGVTNPYSKHAQKIETATTDATIKRFIENREMDIRIDGYLYGKLSRKEMVDYARSFKDIDTFDRLMERYEWEKAIQNIPEKSFWRRMKGIPNEAKAKVFVERLNNSSPAQQKQLWREFGVVSEAGNVISDNLMELITKERYRKVD